MNKYIVEFIGTFFLVFVVSNVVLSDPAPVLGAAAIGSVLMVMIFAGGHISGAHFNPAVTLSVTLRGKCSVADAIPYVVAQVAAAFAAVFAAKFVTGNMGSGDEAATLEMIGLATKDGLMPRAMLAEFLGTFALAYVILNVATAEGTSGNSFYGLAIGMTVFAMAITVGGISGGAFNPAVAVGLCALGKAAWASIWIYLVPNFIGGAAAAAVFRATNGEDSE